MEKIKIERCVLCGPKSADENVAHFNFSKTKYDDWILFCSQADPTKVVFPSSKLCCLHFTSDSFSSINRRHNLKKNAIPSLILNNLETSTRKCNHQINVPIVEKTRNYGFHNYRTHCFLCKGKKTGVSSFEFPKDENIRQKWIEFCNVESSQINMHSRLCQYHFAENDFHVTNCGRVYLNRGTIPSIREVDIANCSRNKNEELLVLHAEEVDHSIPPKRPKMSSLSRCDESISSNATTSLHASNMSYDFNDAGTSSRETLQLTECTLCKMMSSDIIQFRFANSPAMRLVLTSKFGVSPFQLDQIHTVCQSHFDTDDIDIDNDGKKMVKDRAFPWRYFSHMIEKNSNNISPLPMAISTKTITTAELSELGLVTPVRLIRKRKSYVGDMTPSDFRTPRTARKNLNFVQEKFKAVNVKVKQLQDRNRRAALRVNKFVAQIRSLKEKGLITNDVATTVHEFTQNYGSLPVSMRLLISRILRKGDNKYLPELRMFALTLSFYSPAAYLFLRKSWMKALPHPSTIRKWYSSVNGAPGFTEEAFKALKAKITTEPNKKFICNLVIDEVAIRKQIIRERDRAYGQVDLGLTIPPPQKKVKSKNGVKEDNGIMAKNALVFMVVALNSNFKIPIGYFLISSLPGRYRANLLQLALEKLHNTGICISSITFDGASVNFAMCKTLGADFDLSSPKYDPSIKHPITKDPIFIFLDPCHAVKLLRNAIGELRPLSDTEGLTIAWGDIENVFRLEKTCGLRLATKLTKQHVYFKQNKMKVKFAAQVLSESVAVALNYLHKKKLKQFRYSEGTAKFCRMINRAFDILNCSNTHSCKKQPYSKALTPNTRSEIIGWMKEIEEYIRGLVDSRGIQVTDSKRFDRYTGFVGIIICFKNLIRLFDTYEPLGLKFLLSFKLNQDHLETFFSKLRRRGFGNNNPNAVQFEASYKQLLVHHEIRASEKGNCIIEDIPILYVTSPPEQHVPKYDNRVEYMMIDDPLNCLIEEEVDEDDPDNPDEFIIEDENKMLNGLCTQAEIEMVLEDMVEYIAGFAVSNLRAKKLIDEECIKLLTSPTTTNLFLLCKTRGGLCYPSAIVNNACLELEREFRKTAPTGITQSQFYRELIDKIFLVVADSFRAASHHFSSNENHMKITVTRVLDKYLYAKSRHFCRVLIDEITKRQQLTKNILFAHQ